MPVAHQEKWRQMSQGCSQPGQATAHAYGCFGPVMARSTEGNQIAQLIGLLIAGELAKWNFVMHIVFSSLFRTAAHLTAIAVAVPGTVALGRPVGSIIIRVIGP
jgi:hypothetical protein